MIKINNLSVKNFFFHHFQITTNFIQVIHQVNPSEIIKIKIADLTVKKVFIGNLKMVLTITNFLNLPMI